MTTCSCGQPAPDATICAACTNRLRAALESLPELWEQTTIRMAGTKGVDYRRMGGSRSSESPLAIDRGAYEARQAVSNTLTTWARSLAAEGFDFESERLQWPPF